MTCTLYRVRIWRWACVLLCHIARCEYKTSISGWECRLSSRTMQPLQSVFAHAPMNMHSYLHVRFLLAVANQPAHRSHTGLLRTYAYIASYATCVIPVYIALFVCEYRMCGITNWQYCKACKKRAETSMLWIESEKRVNKIRSIYVRQGIGHLRNPDCHTVVTLFYLLLSNVNEPVYIFRGPIFN